MYRDDETYDSIKRVIVDIYIDYGIKNFPIDEKEICKKLGVALVPYSEFGIQGRRLLTKRAPHGYFVKGSKENVPTIYYNDFFESEGSQRFTVFHELKHYVYNDADDSEDDLADFFARYFMCPIPYLLLKNVDIPNEVASCYGTSLSVAEHVCSNLSKRKEKYGYRLFDFEITLIEHLEPALLEVYSKEKGGDEIYE